MNFRINNNHHYSLMLSVKNLQNTFRSATEETHIEFVYGTVVL